MDYINITYLFDKNYMAPTYVSASSLVKSKNEQSMYNIILLEKGINGDDSLIFDRLESSTVKITHIDVNDKLSSLESLKLLGVEGKETAFAKLLLADLLYKYDKAVWIDGDTLIRQDLTDLYAINIENNYLAAVRDNINCYENLTKEYKFQKPYFNSGVMVLNLKKMRLDSICDKLIKKRIELGTTSGFCDQTAYNIICRNYVEIPMKWNFYSDYIFSSEPISTFKKDSMCSYDTKKAMREDSAIIHFTIFKPWVLPNNAKWYKDTLDYESDFEKAPLGNVTKEWYSLLKQSPFTDWLENKISSLYEKNKHNNKKIRHYFYKGDAIFQEKYKFIRYTHIQRQREEEGPYSIVKLGFVRVASLKRDENGKAKRFKLFGIPIPLKLLNVYHKL